MSPRRDLVVALAAVCLATGPAHAGHEFPFYPSYYPQEITLAVVPPGAAAARLAGGDLQAYVGADPFGAVPVPPNVSHAESLGAYVVVSLNPGTPFFTEPARRCVAARSVADSFAAGVADYRPHPYPVTPYHPDFLQHVDLATGATAQGAARWDGPPLRVRRVGPVATALVPTGLDATDPGWDATVETVDVAELWAADAVGPNGWTGPPWLKDGWFHATRVLGGAVGDAGRRQAIETLRDGLQRGAYDGVRERLTLERRLVSALREGCERLVAGYTVRREPLYVEYSNGVENVGLDAQAGLRSAIFPRTVKLKDFPWNGWLAVGTPIPPSAAWNPVAGFTDPASRLVWAAVGDPALFPSPHGGGFVWSRVVATAAGGGPATLALPADAVLPEAGTGRLARIALGRRATTQVSYRVLTSRFHDGTRMAVADLVYAFGFPYRVADPAVARATSLARDRLVGLRVLRVETDVLAFGEDKLTYEVPIVEVFLDHRTSDPQEAAVIAPAWTTTPWHVLALMEEAVGRGLAAFSHEEATRRRVAWLDLVRDAGLRSALLAIVDDFARRGHVPPALAGAVTPDEARARWSALRAFHDAHGHFLVTNGPYRLDRWDATTTVLTVFRDLSYPRGVGQFNTYAVPLRAYVTGAEIRGDELVVTGDVERLERFGRESRIVREPFVKRALEQDKRSLPICRYVVLGPDGAVALAGTVPAGEPGAFRVALRSAGRPGPHTALIALTVDDNRTALPVKVLSWTR